MNDHRKRKREQQPSASRKIFFTIDERSDGMIQLAINDENGGYRICGPKYDGTGRTIRRHDLTPRDIEELRGYLDRVGGS